MRRRRDPVTRTLILTVGWVCIVVGAVVAPLPPPFAFGVLLLVVGLALTSSQSKWMRRAIQWGRGRMPAVSRKLDAVKPRLPGALKRFVATTTPAARDRLARLKRRALRRKAAPSAPPVPSAEPAEAEHREDAQRRA